MDDMNEDAPTDMSVKEEQTRYAETTETDGMNQEAQFADVSSKADEQTGTVETSDQTETRDTDGMAENAQPNVPQKAEEQKRHAETAEVNGMNQEALTEVPSKTDEQTRTFKISGPMVDSWLKIGTDEGLASDALIAGFLLEHYINFQHVDQSAARCTRCHTPLTLMCAKCDLASQTAADLSESKSQATASDSDHGEQFSPVGEYIKGPRKPPGRKTRRAASAVKLEPQSTPGFSGTGSRATVKSEPQDAGNESTGTQRKAGYDGLPVHFQQESSSQGSEARVTLEELSFLDGILTTPSAAASTSSKKKPVGGFMTGKKPFSCPQCDATFQWKNHLRGHLHKVHDVTLTDDTPPPGKQTSKITGRKKRKYVRKEAPPPAQLHVCTDCDASFTKACQLRIHRRGHTGEKPYVCNVCGAAFARTYKLKNHMRRHTGEKPYCCEECGSSYTSSQSLKEHMRIHSGEKPFVCTECGAAFVQHSALKTHMRTHSTDKPYACQLCEAKFKSTYCLKRHIMHLHEKVPRPPKRRVPQSAERLCICEECGKTFSDKNNLKKHMYIHGEKTHVCKECGAAFYKSDALKVHHRIHSGEKPYVCTVCGRAFVQSSAFYKHMRVHTGERPFACRHENCGRAFKGQAERRNHEYTHTKYKPYVCQFCSASFIQQGNLRSHVRMHTDERPYVCDTCGKAFRRLNQLKLHNLMHAGIKPCVCKLCDAAFRKPQTLKFHMQKKHAFAETTTAAANLTQQQQT